MVSQTCCILQIASCYLMHTRHLQGHDVIRGISVYLCGQFVKTSKSPTSESTVLHLTFLGPLKRNFFSVISSNAWQANWICPRASPLHSDLIKPRRESSRSYITDVLTKDAIGLLPILPLLPICSQPFLP